MYSGWALPAMDNHISFASGERDLPVQDWSWLAQELDIPFTPHFHHIIFAPQEKIKYE